MARSRTSRTSRRRWSTGSAGDAFVAGVVDSLLAGLDVAGTLAFAARLAALKCTVAGDMSLASRADVNALASGDLLRR